MLKVYFIQAGLSGPIKIGQANNVTKRMLSLQGANHEQLHLLATIPAHDTLEPFLHARFAANRIRGEWFDPETPGLRDLIESARRGTAPDWALRHVRPHVSSVEEVLGEAAGAAPVRHGETRA